MSVEARVRTMIADTVGLDEDDVQGEILDFLQDSLDRVLIALELEDDFQIEIKDAEIDSWETFDDVVRTVEKQLENNQGR
jgi:acyl carrier protein